MIKETILLVYLVIFLLYFIIKIIIFYKKYRINPVSFVKNKSPEVFYWWLIFIIFFIYGILLLSHYFAVFGPAFSNLTLDMIGFILLIFGFILVIVAHIQMGKSWRMGLDNKIKTKLVTRNLFRLTRNPVYLGLVIEGLAILLLVPNLVTLILFVLLTVDFNLIIKSEEKFLEKQFGKEYLNYKKRVRRFI